jgi:hypothetical protein
MSTMTPIQAPPTPADMAISILTPANQGDQRTVFRGVDWYTYHSLSEATAEGQHVRLAYDGKDLEIIIVASNIHEHLQELINKIVSAVTSGLEIDYLSCGERTWQSEVRGLRADLFYYFDPAKIHAAKDALAHESMNPADYPRPDLAIEIDTSGP